MANIQQFRISMRGFHRQDVQDYIVQMAAAHRQELAELQKKLEKSEHRVGELEGIASRVETATEEASKAQAELDNSNRMVSSLQDVISQTEARLTVAKQEIERLQAQLDASKTMAASYQEFRDRAASMELEAQQKAEDTVSGAKAEAERIHAGAREWLSRVMEEYSGLRRGLDEVLEKVQALAGVPETVRELDITAQQLQDQGGLK